MTALTDRVAVVTGASSGIGAGLAAMLADEGARVVLAARRGEQIDAVAAGIRQAGGVAIPVVTDLTDDASLASLLERTRSELGPVDVLVNNAGFALWKPLEATTIAEWDHTFAVNVRAGRLSVRGCTAWHAGTPVRPGDQHWQRGRGGDRPRSGRLLRQQARPGRADRGHPGRQPRQWDQGLGHLPRVRGHRDGRGGPR